ncbi:hypothetical protein EDF56_105293 [Novosphingobium sp. PhB165]|uniref:hypothetical protein n=1 Tax=Novosphingobium sp. PhB165 TaxID=2485105 RepID=UPI0010D71B62|nr:hypothetical protein [Novosphingobium sp. PhB165]TCM17945.1 hypothetical protein EDF56_105293 [Novosphingobium sp. PhB165]
MSMSRSYCDEMARLANQAAAQATLTNVRDRELRSASAWQAMSERILKTEQAREMKERERVEASVKDDGAEGDRSGKLQ